MANHPLASKFSLPKMAPCAAPTHPSQGLLYGTGQAFIVPLILSLPTQWFFAHRGLATGLVGGFAGCGGALNVIFARELIDRLAGSRKTLGVLSGVQAGVGVVALFLIKEQRRAPMRVDWRRGRLVARDVPEVAMREEPVEETVEKAAMTDAAPVMVEERQEPKPSVKGTEVPGGLRRIFRTGVFWSFWIATFISTLYVLPLEPFCPLTPRVAASSRHSHTSPPTHKTPSSPPSPPAPSRVSRRRGPSAAWASECSSAVHSSA